MNINMKSLKKSAARGFTLIELMIVVAIIGILAVIAVVGVRKYLANAKSAEARQAIGAISRASVQAYEAEKAPSELLTPGNTSAVAARTLCSSAASAVPATAPAGKKYQPNNSAGNYFATGDQTAGWKCLKFSLDQPVAFSYMYAMGAGFRSGGLAGAPAFGATSYEASAQGDLDGDTALSTFAAGGTVVAATGELQTTTVIYENEPEE